MIQICKATSVRRLPRSSLSISGIMKIKYQKNKSYRISIKITFFLFNKCFNNSKRTTLMVQTRKVVSYVSGPRKISPSLVKRSPFFRYRGVSHVTRGWMEWGGERVVAAAAQRKNTQSICLPYKSEVPVDLIERRQLYWYVCTRRTFLPKSKLYLGIPSKIC